MQRIKKHKRRIGSGPNKGKTIIVKGYARRPSKKKRKKPTARTRAEYKKKQKRLKRLKPIR